MMANHTTRAGAIATVVSVMLASPGRAAAPPPPLTSAPSAPADPPAPATAPAAKPAGLPAAEPPPSQAEIDADFEAGRHDAVLRQVRAALECKGSEAKAYDRARLLRTRGESLLRTKQAEAAARAFDEAAREADGLAARAELLATALLVRRANAGLQYVGRRPDAGDKTRPPPSADVVDPDSRRRALAALFADELAAHRRRIEAAAASPSLKDALDVLPALQDLAALERTATGSTETIADLATGLDARVGNHLEEAAAAVENEIKGHAGYALAAVRQANVYKLRGLGGRAGRVWEIARQADGMRQVCLGCEDLFTDSDRDFAGLRKRVERTRDLARDLLGRDYSASYANAWTNPYDPRQSQPRQQQPPPAARPQGQPGQRPGQQPPPMGRRLPRAPAQ